MTRTQKDCPTPKTSASKEIILFPAALYTPAMAAPSHGGKEKEPSLHMRTEDVPEVLWLANSSRSPLEPANTPD